MSGDDVAGEVERYQFWIEDLIRQRNDALGRVDDLAGHAAIADAEAETRYPEVVPDPEPEREPEREREPEVLEFADSRMVEKMRWSLGLRAGQFPMGPEEPGWLYLLPDGSRTNSCDEARAGWLIHCEQVGERMKSVVGGMRQVIMEAVDGDSVEEGEPGPYEVELLNALSILDTIISTTIAQAQPTPPEMLPVRQRPRSIVADIKQEIEDGADGYGDVDADPTNDTDDTNDTEEPDAAP